jgi:putative addiction module killer protein
MIVESKQVKLYKTRDGKTPYVEWVTGIKDQLTKGRIDARATDLARGKLGKCKPVGEGVTELIQHGHGPGYRIYIGEFGSKIIILLCGGDKSTQQTDIKQAKAFWKDYKERERKERALEWDD